MTSAVSGWDTGLCARADLLVCIEPSRHRVHRSTRSKQYRKNIGREATAFSWELTDARPLSTIPGEYKREFFQKAAYTRAGMITRTWRTRRHAEYIGQHVVAGAGGAVSHSARKLPCSCDDTAQSHQPRVRFSHDLERHTVGENKGCMRSQRSKKASSDVDGREFACLLDRLKVVVYRICGH